MCCKCIFNLFCAGSVVQLVTHSPAISEIWGSNLDGIWESSLLLTNACQFLGEILACTRFLWPQTYSSSKNLYNMLKAKHNIMCSRLNPNKSVSYSNYLWKLCNDPSTELKINSKCTMSRYSGRMTMIIQCKLKQNKRTYCPSMSYFTLKIHITKITWL